jgi:flagellar basal-body rod protein FlgB
MFEINGSALMTKSLDALWMRQKVITNNIANVDTPNFKKSEVEFEDFLDKSMLGATENDSEKIPDTRVKTSTDTSEGKDGNNVNIDKEYMELYRDQLQYAFMIRKLSDQFSNVKLVLSDVR